MKRKKEVEATLRQRLLSYLIDLFVSVALSMFFMLSASSIWKTDSGASIGYFQVACLLICFVWLYGVVPIKNNGQTLGDIFMKIKVIDSNNASIKLSRSIVRNYFIKFLFAPAFIIAQCIWMLIKRNDEKYILDVFFKTHVIQNKE